MPESEVQLHTVLTIARPPRVAIGLPDTISPSDWCNLLRKVASRWGGLDSTVYFPSDEWSPGSLWDRLLLQFDPDEVLWLHPPSDPEIFTQRYAPFQCREYSRLLDASCGTLPINLAAPTHLAARAWLGMPGGTPMTAIHSGAVVGGQESLRVLLAREFGQLGDEDLGHILEPGLFGMIIRMADPIDLSNSDLAPIQAMDIAYGRDNARPAAWGSLGLHVLEEPGAQEWREGPILVCGSAGADICLWLTLRTLRQGRGVFWLPDDMVPADGDGDSPPFGYVARLTTILSGFGDAIAVGDVDESAYDRDPVLVSSATLPDAELEVRWKTLLRLRPDLRPPQLSRDVGPAIRARRLLAANHPREVSYPFTRGISHAYIEPDLPLWMTAGGRSPTFLTELRIDGLSVPAHPAIPPVVGARRDTNVLNRSGAYGPVANQSTSIVFVREGEPRPFVPIQVRIPDIDEVIQRYATWLGGTASPSSAGRLARDLVSRLGGIEEAGRVLCEGPLVKTLAAFARRNGGQEAPPLGHFAVRDRIYLDRSAINDLVTSEVAGVNPDEVVLDWTVRGIIHWGMLLRCPACRYRALYRWGALQDSGPVCMRCTRQFTAAPSSACTWSPVAGLDELVQASLENDVREEIVLAAWILSTEPSSAVTLDTEWDCPGVHAESDVVGIVNGNLVLAEAKSGNSVSKSQHGKYENLARRTQARRLIFATSSARWSEGTGAWVSSLRERLPGTSVEVYADILGPNGPSAVQ